MASVQAGMADRRQAERAKWWPYAGAAPACQVVAATTTPRAVGLPTCFARASLPRQSTQNRAQRRFAFAAERVAVVQLLRRSAAEQLLARIVAPCTALLARPLHSPSRAKVRVL